MICCKYNMFGLVNCILVNINEFCASKGGAFIPAWTVYYYTILLNISCNSTVSSEQPNNGDLK